MRSMHPWPIFPPNLEPPAARSLSLLFILQELIDSFRLLERLKEKSREDEIPFLLQEMEKFLLSSLENPFSQKGGFLDKLCFYCGILLQASKISDESLLILLEDMRSSLLRLKAKFFRKIPEGILTQIADCFADLEQKFRSFFSALTPFLQEAKTDENVLIHLIENKLTFNRYLGARVIEDLLRKFFPAGQPQLRAVICEGSTRRGFTAFFAEKEPLIEELEWETPCLPPQNL